MHEKGLSYKARKALMVHIGEEAGAEIADYIAKLTAEIEQLRRQKVDITEIVPSPKAFDDPYDQQFG